MEIHGLAESLREKMSRETKSMQRCFMYINIFILLTSLVMAGFYLGAASNVSKYQTYSEKNGRSSNIFWYDVDCYDGPFSDTAKAMSYLDSINCDLDCQKSGSKWSVFYNFNGAIYMLIAFNAVFMILSIYKIWIRMIGTCCNCVLGCINMAAIITTAAFRFRPMGKVCAMSTAPVKVVSDDYLSDSRTYQSDAIMI